MRPIFDVPNVGRIAILQRAGRRRHRLDDTAESIDGRKPMQRNDRFAERMAGCAQALLARKGIHQGARSVSAARRAAALGEGRKKLCV